MGDWETPGTGAAEPSPETCQEHHPPPPVHDDALQEHLSHEKQQRQLKRSSLPARPHAAARHTKRLTLNFPINLPAAAAVDSHVSSSPGAMTPVARSSAHQSPVPPVGTPMAFDDQDDGSGLLTAIAAQERKVLELREELQRAESELDSLKKQWAQSEKTKKRTEISHRAEPLLPLRSPDSIGPEPAAVGPQHSRDRSVASSEASSAAPTPSSARYSRELERRQSMLAAATKGTKVSASGRRVFQGSHTRTLSLLSPTSGTSSPLGAAETPDGDRIGRSPRSATLPSVERSPMMTAASGDNRDFATSSGDDVITQWRRTMPPPSREALMRTGRQMASDLREGLWTFLEDIRQATVGEEGISATESRAMPNARNKRDSSSASSRSRDRLSVAQGGKLSRSPSSSGSKAAKSSSGKDSQSADIDSSFWSEFGIDPPGQTSHPPAAAQPAPRHAQNGSSTDQHPTTTNNNSSSHLDVDDNWDDWDTPQPKKMHTPSSSRSTLESKQDQSPMTQNSSPRTSTSFGDWRQHDTHIPDPSVSDGIPWPAITKLAPSKLTRTASNLMAEWERSLSPSPERKVQTRSPSLDKDAKTD